MLLVKGWGHYYATQIFNNTGDPTAMFGYYKEFWIPGFPMEIPPPAPPPAWLDPKDWSQWMEYYCPGANRGVELDWLTFFWEISYRVATAPYSKSDFASVFRNACGGQNCTSPPPTWAQLQIAANAVFGGAGSEKALNWQNVGQNEGVDN